MEKIIACAVDGIQGIKVEVQVHVERGAKFYMVGLPDNAVKESHYRISAALKNNGSVVTWGDNRYGGDSSSVSSQLNSGVTQIFSNSGAFAALKNDGSVVTWGNSDYGGDSSSVDLSSGVTQIFSTGYFRPTASTFFNSLKGNKETRELIGSLIENSFGKWKIISLFPIKKIWRLHLTKELQAARK